MFNSKLLLILSLTLFSAQLEAKNLFKSFGRYVGARQDSPNLSLKLIAGPQTTGPKDLNSLLIEIDPQNGIEKAIGLAFSPNFFKYALLDLSDAQYARLFESKEVLKNFRLYNSTRDSGEFNETVDVDIEQTADTRILTFRALVDHNPDRETNGIDLQRKTVTIKLHKARFSFVSVKKELHYLTGAWKTILKAEANLH